MISARISIPALLVLGVVAGATLLPAPGSAQFGREPEACMEIATDYAGRLAGHGDIAPLVDTQAQALAALDEIAARDEVQPFDRLQEAEALLRGRDLWDAARAIRGVARTIDNSSSVVAGWRGLYCPSARPTGAAGLDGQERCDALSATFVDQLRIDNPAPREIREREAREAERQTILKARTTRTDRDDLLELWRIRTDAYDTLKVLERALVLQEAGAALLERVRDAGCLAGESS
ncbi:hypothetical protein [Salinarimonas ramus]|uniref:Uncharacterized protein n=1 Tax=Salinarimonas ramus TaxID=690164 RepID=A0A917QFQ9_9HYPH|nr:hypothetical protein [Salinarimonas ramus]GGK48658.1 hypothetical protein GCM10011322_39580 [Salinarimonas ramus]